MLDLFHALARDLDAAALRALVACQSAPRTLGILSEARVNVLELNLTLNPAAAH